MAPSLKGRISGIVFLLLLLFCVGAQAGMFDLPEGHWEEEPGESFSYFEMKIGSPESKSFELVFGERSKDSRMTQLTGTYKVLANKGDPHFSWKITDVTVRGKGPQRAVLGSLTVEKGDELSGYLSLQGDSATLTIFDDQSQPVVTRTLTERENDK